MQMSADEKKHAEVWKNITKKNIKPNIFSIMIACKYPQQVYNTAKKAFGRKFMSKKRIFI